MYRNNMEKVKHLDTTHRDTNIQAKINNMRQKHERDSGVRGSPNPWDTSTKRSHCVTFISLRKFHNTNVSIHFFSVIIMVSSLGSLSELFPHYPHKQGILHKTKQGIASILKFANLTISCLHQYVSPDYHEKKTTQVNKTSSLNLQGQ